MTPAAAPRGRTAWARNLAAPVRDFLSTETGGAIVLVCAIIGALAWANSPWPDSYESVWTTELAIRLGDDGVAMDLRHWVNQGLMTLFFLVVGLEAKRELDIGQLRERRRLTLPALAAVGGAVVPVLIYLAVTAGCRDRWLGHGGVDGHGPRPGGARPRRPRGHQAAGDPARLRRR